MKLIKYDIEQLKTKQGQKKYLLQQTVKWWIILFIIYIILNSINIPSNSTFLEHIINMYSFKILLFTLLFCLVLSFVYALIKLISIKNIIKENKYEKED